MLERNLSLTSDRIVIAQLLGMKDHLTYTLGQSGFPTAKLYHYGEVYFEFWHSITCGDYFLFHFYRSRIVCNICQGA